MASTKKAKTVPSEQEKQLVTKQIDQLLENLKTKFNQYEKLHDRSYPIELVSKDDYDFVRPDHYKQDDGKETWERMVDKYGVEKTANFCELNAFKYQDRKGKKPGESITTEEKKIAWYSNKANELYESISEFLENREKLDAILNEVIQKNTELEAEKTKLSEIVSELKEKLTKFESNQYESIEEELKLKPKPEEVNEKDTTSDMASIGPSVNFIERAKKITELYLKTKNKNNE